MKTYVVMVERTIVEQYHIMAESTGDANDKFVQQRLDEGWGEPVYIEELESEVREEDTFLLEGGHGND